VTKRVFIRTLGCPKNEADSEHLRGMLERAGYRTVRTPASADVVVVNTCSFIEASRRESVEAILDELDSRGSGQSVVVSGCLVERYGAELASELPEVDAFMSLGAYGRAVQIIEAARDGTKQRCFDAGKVPLDVGRPSVPTGGSAFLKISEGCDRVCAFCAIPQIRGGHRSRAPEEILDEARWLASCGVHEVVLVGQDMSLYGRDLTGRWELPGLLRQLGTIEGVGWYRMLYQYPRFVDTELVDAVAETPSVAPYFDLSLQHASAKIVRKMRRWGDGQRFLDLIGRLRERIPDAVLRSAFIVGFPGETDADVAQLAEFLPQARLDWAGFFVFSPEEGTEAGSFTRGRVPHAVAERRAEILRDIQDEIAERKRAELVGAEVEVLVEARRRTAVAGRTWREAPEVDGQVIVQGARSTRVGEVVRARVVATDGLDAVAEPLQAAPQRRTLTVSARR
jgi:ribosomal protein S12 methylthiotransferase RimO